MGDGIQFEWHIPGRYFNVLFARLYLNTPARRHHQSKDSFPATEPFIMCIFSSGIFAMTRVIARWNGFSDSYFSLSSDEGVFELEGIKVTLGVSCEGNPMRGQLQSNLYLIAIKI